MEGRDWVKGLQCEFSGGSGAAEAPSLVDFGQSG